MKTKRFFSLSILLFLTVIAFAQKPIAFCEGSVYNFKTIKEADGPVTHTFIIKNMGKAPLVINNVITSCGCTTPSWTKKPIMPGKTGEVKVTFDPEERPGSFSKTISVYNNAAKKPLMLTVRGQVVGKKTE